MAKWRSRRFTYLGRRLIPPGEPFDTDAPPGRVWEPLDDAARVLAAERDERLKPPPPPPPPPEKPGDVEIPADWMELRPERVVNLARRLGAFGRCNFPQAVKFIEDELQRRAPTENDNG